MILAGDEFGRTQGGNNNAYCQDSEISWLGWNMHEKGQAVTWIDASGSEMTQEE